MKYIDEKRWEEASGQAQALLKELGDMATRQVGGFNDSPIEPEDAAVLEMLQATGKGVLNAAAAVHDRVKMIATLSEEPGIFE